jgi:hypothetical protein
MHMNETPHPEASCPNLSETHRSLQKLTDWSTVPKGTIVELRRGAIQIRLGLVDDVTPDGSMLWLSQYGAEKREIIHRSDGYEVCLVEERGQKPSLGPWTSKN